MQMQRKIDGDLFSSHLYSCFGVINCNYSKLVMEKKLMIIFNGYYPPFNVLHIYEM